MKTYESPDVSDFVTGRTGNYEKSPPEHVWENIRKSIPEYSIRRVNVSRKWYYIGGVSLSVLVIALLIILNIDRTGQQSGNSRPSSGIHTKEINKISTGTNGISSEQPVSTEKSKSSVSFEQNEDKSTVVGGEKDKKNTANADNITLQTGSSEKNKNNNTVNTSGTTKEVNTFNLSASDLPVVTRVYFTNEKNEVVLSIKNPVKNKFGFYPVDISSIPAVTYSIYVETPDGTISKGEKTFE
jgi:hypothetical protein